MAGLAGAAGPAGGLLAGVLGEARPGVSSQVAAEERPSLGANSSIAADEQGRPWVTDEAKRTFRLSGVVWEALPGENTDIGLGGDTAWGIGAQPSDVGGCSLYQWDESGRTWHRDPVAYGVRIAVDNGGVPWHINAQNGIYRGIASSVRNVAGAGRDIGAGGGAVWLIGTNAGAGGFGIWVWDEEGSRWLQDATGAGTRIAVDSSGLPWVVNSHGSIFRKG
ncbi:MAG TPA: hypothetical protein VLE27_14310, partial [Thermoanaerobaculia bacterium]|nr:hypothetical protein [Thermoanaerobaculia bacterium]